MSNSVAIPAKFWASLSPAEFLHLAMNDGELSASECARLWKMTDRQDTPPDSLKIMINREDLMRVFPIKNAAPLALDDPPAS
jgi:hypothetical protein